MSPLFWAKGQKRLIDQLFFSFGSNSDMTAIQALAEETRRDIAFYACDASAGLV